MLERPRKTRCATDEKKQAAKEEEKEEEKKKKKKNSRRDCDRWVVEGRRGGNVHLFLGTDGCRNSGST